MDELERAAGSQPAYSQGWSPACWSFRDDGRRHSGMRTL